MYTNVLLYYFEDCRNQGRWIWDFGEAEEAQSEEPRFVIDGMDQVCLVIALQISITL